MNTEGNSTGTPGSTDIMHNVYRFVKKLWTKLPSWAKGTFLPFIMFGSLLVIMYLVMGRDMEMRCDEAVLSGESGIAKPYSMALLSFAAPRRFPAPAFPASWSTARCECSTSR